MALIQMASLKLTARIVSPSSNSSSHLSYVRHSMDPDDPQIFERISEKIPADVAVPRYPDPWHLDPPDVDMA